VAFSVLPVFHPSRNLGRGLTSVSQPPPDPPRSNFAPCRSIFSMTTVSSLLHKDLALRHPSPVDPSLWDGPAELSSATLPFPFLFLCRFQASIGIPPALSPFYAGGPFFFFPITARRPSLPARCIFSVTLPSFFFNSFYLTSMDP